MSNQHRQPPRIEDMSAAEIRERILSSMSFENEHPIGTIPYMGRVSEVVACETEELVARCPMTGYPDFYRCRVIFVPGELLPELKSLKLYYYGFIDLPVSHEHLAAKIFIDFCDAVRPAVCRLELIAGVRGGIETTVVAGEKDPALLPDIRKGA